MTSDALQATLTQQVQQVLLDPRFAQFNPASAHRLAKVVVHESIRVGVDPLFVTAVIKYESSFNRNALSHKGAAGLMQILPSTGEYISKRYQLDWRGVPSLFEAEVNVRIGVTYLKYLERRFRGRWDHVLIAYNWGPFNLSNAIATNRTAPGSTIKYVKRILSTHLKWRSHVESAPV
jgi:soluble lytic murein transglycosylase-like protein